MRSSARSTIVTTAWGLFCACSWTWCIGMFLPVIMLERYGWPGFVVFAVPNVIGCAAFGYVLRTRSASASLAARHGGAAGWFSVLTIAYHMLFASIVVLELLPRGTVPICLATLAALYGGGLLLSRLGDRAWLALAALTWAGSATIFAVLLGQPSSLAGLVPERPPIELGWLMMVIVAGFAFCPYLDLTFHRTLQRSPSRHAFAVFGAAFAVMIVMTVVLWFRPAPVLTALALAHLAAQSMFTVGAHLRELRERPGATPARAAANHAVPWLAGLGFVVAKAVLGAAPIGTDAYLRMMVAWGLVFPLYVWLFIGPGAALPKTRRTLAWYGVAVVLCLPFFEAGFIHHATWLLIIPLLVVAVGRRVARRTPRFVQPSG